MMDTYIGSCGQRTQRHLSVWVNLYTIINRILAESFSRTYIRNADDNGIEDSKRLEICGDSGVQLAHRRVCTSDRVHNGFHWTGSGHGIRYVVLCILNTHSDVFSRYLTNPWYRRCMQPQVHAPWG